MRKVSYGVGVERTLPVHTPTVAKIEVVSRGDVRRAKLYYLRDRVGKAAQDQGEGASVEQVPVLTADRGDLGGLLDQFTRRYSNPKTAADYRKSFNGSVPLDGEAASFAADGG